MPGRAAPALNASHLARLEAESIHILRKAVVEVRKPVMLFSAGKDSTVLAHLGLRAFAPGAPPFPLLNVDSTWEFRSLIEFRDAFARQHGFDSSCVLQSRVGGGCPGRWTSRKHDVVPRGLPGRGQGNRFPGFLWAFQILGHDVA